MSGWPLPGYSPVSRLGPILLMGMAIPGGMAQVADLRLTHIMSSMSRRLISGAWLIASGALVVATPCLAQDSLPDSAARSRPDSTVMSQSDSAFPSNPDSVAGPRPDSGAASKPDSGAASKPDSGAASKPDSGAGLPPDTVAASPNSLKKIQGEEATVPAPPADPALTAACNSSPAASADLLLVVFFPDVRAAERAAVARRVNGKLLGRAGDEGSYYLQVPGDGSDRLRAVADQVIRLPGVQEVGTRTCPPISQGSGTPPLRKPS
jgi:hypothetical protein